MHNDYTKPDKNRKESDGDIGLLVMEKPVTYNDHIQPICLPTNGQNIIEVKGIVAGYGKTGPNESITKFPQHLQMSSIKNLDCFYRYRDASRIVSERSFCAGSDDGIPCFGKSIN